MDELEIFDVVQVTGPKYRHEFGQVMGLALNGYAVIVVLWSDLTKKIMFDKRELRKMHLQDGNPINEEGVKMDHPGASNLKLIKGVCPGCRTVLLVNFDHQTFLCSHCVNIYEVDHALERAKHLKADMSLIEKLWNDADQLHFCRIMIDKALDERDEILFGFWRARQEQLLGG